MPSKTKPLETMHITAILFDGHQEAETLAAPVMTPEPEEQPQSTCVGISQQVEACIS